MINKNLEFYNVGELKQNEFENGVKIYRYPLEVRKHLDGYGKREAESCRGCEVRFVTEEMFWYLRGTTFTLFIE
jgi:hypothetical protein